MNVQVENLPHCITTLRVEVEPEKVTKAWDHIASDYARHARIPGYRPGKAPRKIIEKKFEKQIREELQKQVLSESCREAINEKKLRVLSLAEVEEVEIADDRTMRFTATLVTAPEFEMPDYKNIAVTVKPAEVTDAEVDAAIENLRNQSADFTDIAERGLQMDDFAVVDYTGTIDGKAVHELFPKAGKPLSGNNDFWIRLTPESFFPGFSEQLIGGTLGEAREFDIDVPADFAVTEMAGQKIHYAVTVKGLKQKQLPELTDEFAAKIAPGKNVAELREIAKTELEREKASQAENDKRNQIVTQLLAKVECELPQNLVQNETRRILADIVRENQARGVADELIRENEKDLVGSAAQSARDRLKSTFILLRIAEAEKISVTKEEYQQRIAALAGRYG
ncbi:MAG: trigger factor, partial [Chthoniobacter sp.]|nr:trigger factor [Chthoniobacter sp.]